MPGYWWQCDTCGQRTTFKEVVRTTSIGPFLWDIMPESNWDQALLTHRCVACEDGRLRITYDFPRGKPETISVVHIVGLDRGSGYLPMLWETFRHSSPQTFWYDFKYLTGRNPFGLSKPAVLERQQLRQLFELLALRANYARFP